MTDSSKLEQEIKNSGIKKGYLAKKLGLTPYGLALKINNKNEFKASEIKKLVCLLSLGDKAKDDIFFNQ